jgi:hypothetical protein
VINAPPVTAASTTTTARHKLTITHADACGPARFHASAPQG